LLLTVALFFLLGLSLSGEDPEQTWGKFGYGYISPHIPVAKPYVKGKVKVVVIAQTFSQRESVELWERLDAEVSPVMTYSQEVFAIPGGPGSGGGDLDQVYEEDVLAAAEKALSGDFDVVVLGKAKWLSIPQKFRAKILSAVFDRGAGLLIVDPLGEDPPELKQVLAKNPLSDEDGYFRYATGWKELPYFREKKREEIVQLAKFGKGRIVVLRYGQERPNTSTFQTLTPSNFAYTESKYRPLSADYDYYLSLVARAVLWAAKMESDVAIREIRLPSGRLLRSEVAGENIFLDIENHAAKPRRMTLLWDFRDLAKRIGAQGSKKILVKEGKSEVAIKLPALAGGTSYLEVWLKEKDKVADWALLPIEIKVPCEIVDLKPVKFGFEKGEEISGSFRIEGELPDGAEVSVELSDTLGRLVERTKAQKVGENWRFKFPGQDPKTLLHIAEVQIKDDKGLVAWKRTKFPIRYSIPPDEFLITMWTHRNMEPVEGILYERLRQFGVDAQMPGWLYSTSHPEMIESEALYLSHFNLLFHPYMFSCEGGVANITGPYLWEPNVWSRRSKGARDLCFLRSPDWRKRMMERQRACARVLKPYGLVAAYFQEEGAMDFFQRDPCWCKACIKAFREYLKDSYGTLEALNASWGTEFKDWSEVMPITRVEAIKTGRFPAWADHRRFMQLSWTKLYTDSIKPWLEEAPEARPGWGYCNAPGHESDTGIDRALYLADAKSQWAQLYTMEGIVSRSFLPKDALVQVIYGLYEGDRGDDNILGNPWKALARGYNGVFYYRLGSTRAQGGSSPFIPSYDEAIPMFERTARQWKEIKSGIAKLLLRTGPDDDGVRLYYSPISDNASILRNEETKYADSLVDFAFALDHAGIGYRCLSYLQLERGELNYPDVKVLILPYCQALSKREARAISDFARSGGLVIADFAPGIMDEHCKMLEKSSLSELFPEMKALKVTEVGKGKAAYIGDMVKGYYRERISGAGGKKVRGLATLIRECAGISPRVRLNDSSGDTFYEAHISHFTDGQAEYALLLRERSSTASPVEVTVKFSRSGHIYDVREKKYLGKGDNAKLTLAPWRAKLIALLPYRVLSVSLRLKRAEGRKITWSARLLGGAGRWVNSVLRMTLSGPDGKEMPIYSTNAVAEEGKCAGSLRLALNDPPGEYSLKATDVVSGLSDSFKFRIEEEGR